MRPAQWSKPQLVLNQPVPATYSAASKTTPQQLLTALSIRVFRFSLYHIIPGPPYPHHTLLNNTISLKMHAGHALLALGTALIVPVTAQFGLKDTFIGQDFFGGFNWETFDDPTHGRVNYVDQGTAQQTNLSYGTLHPHLSNHYGCGKLLTSHPLSL